MVSCTGWMCHPNHATGMAHLPPSAAVSGRELLAVNPFWDCLSRRVMSSSWSSLHPMTGWSDPPPSILTTLRGHPSFRACHRWVEIVPRSTSSAPSCFSHSLIENLSPEHSPVRWHKFLLLSLFFRDSHLKQSYPPLSFTLKYELSI